MTTELAYTYNDFGLPVKLTYTDVDGETRTVREETNLTYDGNGNILTEAVTEAYSGSTTKTRTYQYDLGNRLISAAYDGTTTTYTYDAVGNRLTRQEGTETAETYTYNYLNQLTRVQQGTAVTTYTYDARGNQMQQVQTGTGVTTTTNYGYDLANRLTSTSISNNAVIPLSTSATYAYNAQGQRVTRVEDEVITHFYYTGSALLFTTVNEYVLQTQNILDPSGTIVASKRFEGQAETEQDPYADDYFFYRYDIRGSVTNIVDGEGAVVKSYDYDEFGVTTSTGDSFFNEVTFTGSVADASGLLYMNARYYNPATARFLSQDSYTGSASDPWTQHLYAYCNNNPVNLVDPTGHVPKGVSKIITIQAKSLISGGVFHDAQGSEDIGLADIFDDPDTWSFKNDYQGISILWHYLFGGGKDFNKKDGVWGNYMKRNPILKKKVQDMVFPYGATLDVGQSISVDIITSMEIDNGEDIIGYQYLHGTNADAGGFVIAGTIQKDKKSNLIYDLTYTWNDIIDPNFQYYTDSIKYQFAKSIPFANPTDYKISISWSDKTIIKADPGLLNWNRGWLKDTLF